MQEIFFFFDDSGVLHGSNKTGIFVYAGYCFTDRSQLDTTRRKYIDLVKKIKKELCRTDEIKAYGLERKYKRALFNIMRMTESLSVGVDIAKLHEHILSSPKSICRYKDFVLKRAVKREIISLVKRGIIDPSKDTKIEVSVDEQLTATDGIYGLKETIYEELRHGIANYNYGVFFEPVFTSDIKVSVKFCESKSNYMIQASDILANRIFTSFVSNKPELREIPNHIMLTLP